MIPQNYYTLLLLPLGVLLFSNRIAGWLKVVIFIAGLGVCVYAQSRGMLLAYCISTFLLTIQKRWLCKYALPVIILSTAIAAALFYYKPASAEGRWLIWKVTFTKNSNWWWGNGPGSFQENYQTMQCSYFEQQRGSKTEKLLAGMPVFAFNEYLQLLYEYGLPGFLLLATVLAALTLLFIRNTANAYRRKVLLFPLYILLITSCFTYMLHYSLIAIVTAAILCIMLISFLADWFKWPDRTFAGVSGILFVAAFVIWRLIEDRQVQQHRLLYEALNQLPEQPQESGIIILAHYKRQPHNNENKMRVYQYWLAAGDTASALAFSDSLITRRKYYYPLMMSAAGLLALRNQPGAALNYLEKCRNILPGYMEPVFKAMYIYAAKGDFDNALQAARRILTMPVKIPSEKTNSFRSAAQEMMVKYSG